MSNNQPFGILGIVKAFVGYPLFYLYRDIPFFAAIPGANISSCYFPAVRIQETGGSLYSFGKKSLLTNS